MAISPPSAHIAPPNLLEQRRRSISTASANSSSMSIRAHTTMPTGRTVFGHSKSQSGVSGTGLGRRTGDGGNLSAFTPAFTSLDRGEGQAASEAQLLMSTSWTAEREEIRDGSARLASLSLLQDSPPSASGSSKPSQPVLLLPSTSSQPSQNSTPMSSPTPREPSGLAKALSSAALSQQSLNGNGTANGSGSSPESVGTSAGGGSVTPTPSKPGSPPTTRATFLSTPLPVVEAASPSEEEEQEQEAMASRITILGDEVGGDSSDDEDDHLGFEPTERTALLGGKAPAQAYAQAQTLKSRAGTWATGQIKKVRNVKFSVADGLETGKIMVSSLPAVVLGVLMNILDGVSYGMIMFPTNIPVFADYGGIGVSMFFVSCVVSQLVYSAGGSIFKGGNGSMMIEVVPFFHSIVNIINNSAPTDKSVVATTMVAFAISSILTGMAFFALGAFKLGSMSEFFPRHILVGCIGGVGAFLVVTGFQVSARLEEAEGFSLDLLRHFFDAGIWPLWFVPLGLAIGLRVITEFFSHPLIFPGYFLAIPVVFYIVVAALGVSVEHLRKLGWVFEATGVDSAWYEYWTLFDFAEVDAGALLDTIPTQFALVFFGLLHVPVNVPALAISVGEDNVDTNRELVAHGLSNALAGLLGTVPNYLCYVNSVLFYRIGGTTRVSGFMLAAASTGVLIAGPGVIGYLPVSVVGALIFILGIDLVREAVWDTYYRVSRFEYITIWIIIIVMTVFDFVVGIGVGIILACVSFVITSSQRRAVRTILNGAVTRSTVRRHPKQSAFLRNVGSQTRVIKLQGFLFFGTISACETTIRKILEAASWSSSPIRFLVLDFSMASGVDFSAAEAFVRIQRLLDNKGVVLALCGCPPDSSVGIALRSVDLWTDSDDSRVEVFENLNDALEHCENAFLRTLYSKDFGIPQIQTNSVAPAVPASPQIDLVPKIESPVDASQFAHSPRMSHLRVAAKETFSQQRQESPPKAHYKQPLPLLMQSLRPFSPDFNEDFCFRLVPYFKKTGVQRGETLWKNGDVADSFYLIESGMLRAAYLFLDKTHAISESMVAGTAAGETSFLARSKRNSTVVAERESVLWKLDIASHEKMGEKEGWLFCQKFGEALLRISIEESEILMGHLISSL